MKWGVKILLVIIISGCVTAKEFTTYYFYHPRCPSCIAMTPFIDYLEERYGVVINRYDVSTAVGSQTASQYNITAVPTLLILTEKGFYKYTGRLEILNSEYVIAELKRMPTPERPFNITYVLDPMRCLLCHRPTEEQRKMIPEEVLLQLNASLPPPSTYSCDYCCHSS